MQDNNTNNNSAIYVKIDKATLREKTYTHIAYADNIDGTQGFTTGEGEEVVDKDFVGLLFDNSKEESQNPNDYLWYDLSKVAKDDPGPAGEEGIPAEPQPNIGKKRIPKWVQWVIVIMVTGAIGFNFSGIAIGVVLWFVFDWINGNL